MDAKVPDVTGLTKEQVGACSDGSCSVSVGLLDCFDVTLRWT